MGRHADDPDRLRQSEHTSVSPYHTGLDKRRWRSSDPFGYWLQPFYSQTGRQRRFSVDMGGNSQFTKACIHSGQPTLVNTGGRMPNRIHTHEAAGSSPAPPTSV